MSDFTELEKALNKANKLFKSSKFDQAIEAYSQLTQHMYVYTHTLSLFLFVTLSLSLSVIVSLS